MGALGARHLLEDPRIELFATADHAGTIDKNAGLIEPGGQGRNGFVIPDIEHRKPCGSKVRVIG